LEYSASFLHNYLYYSYVLQLFGLHLFATYILYLALNDHFFLLNSTENYGRRCLTPLRPHRNYILSYEQYHFITSSDRFPVQNSNRFINHHDCIYFHPAMTTIVHHSAIFFNCAKSHCVNKNNNKKNLFTLFS